MKIFGKYQHLALDMETLNMLNQTLMEEPPWCHIHGFANKLYVEKTTTFKHVPNMMDLVGRV